MRYTFVLTLLLILFSACGKQSEVSVSDVEAIDTTSLRVAVMPTLDCLPLYVAFEHGMFKHAGADVQLLSFQAQMDCDTAIERGHAEGVVSDLVRTERMQQQGFPLRYVSATNLSWQLLTNKAARIRQLSGLDNKMIAMTRYSATALLADRVVSQAQLDPAYVFCIQVNDISVRLGMLETGVMDALLLPEPQATQARLMGNPVLMDSQEQDLKFGVVAFSEKALKLSIRQQQLEAFLKGYNMACDSINKYGVVHYKTIMERYCGITPAIVDSLPRVSYPHACEPRQSDVNAARQWLDEQRKKT